jgi:hypothetical protein
MATKMGNCKGVPFNYEPEYNTAARKNIIPWAALQTNISTQFEIGHWTPCTSLSDPASNFDDLISFTAGDEFWLKCNGPYEAEDDSTNPEGFGGDAFCYPAGDEHTALNQFGVFADPNTDWLPRLPEQRHRLRLDVLLAGLADRRSADSHDTGELRPEGSPDKRPYVRPVVLPDDRRAQRALVRRGHQGLHGAASRTGRLLSLLEHDHERQSVLDRLRGCGQRPWSEQLRALCAVRGGSPSLHRLRPVRELAHTSRLFVIG